MTEMGGAIMAEMSWVGGLFVGGMLKEKHWSSGENPFRSSHDHGFQFL